MLAVGAAPFAVSGVADRTDPFPVPPVAGVAPEPW